MHRPVPGTQIFEPIISTVEEKIFKTVNNFNYYSTTLSYNVHTDAEVDTREPIKHVGGSDKMSEKDEEIQCSQSSRFTQQPSFHYTCIHVKPGLITIGMQGS